MIAGGTARNIVARDCAFQWEFRGLPGVASSAARDRLDVFTQALLEREFKDHPGTGVETVTETDVPGLAPEPGSAAERLAMRLAKANRTIAVPYASEAGQFQRAGVSTVLCGPGRIDEAHQPDEFVEIGELAACIEFMRGLARELSA